MTASVAVHRIAVDAIPLLQAKAWRDDVLRRYREGSRVVTLYGRKLGDDVLITTVFRDQAGAFELTRSKTSVQFGYHELTSEVPALHCFERELHEQTGVRIAGHPWLKPIRYEGSTHSGMASYPFYKVEGKEVHEVAVGPIHAGVIEPGSFRFMCHGEQVHHLEIQLGYQHRGVEALLLRGDARHQAPLVETISGDSSIAHTWAYCAAIEDLTGRELDIETEMSRAFMLELERVAMHLSGLSGLSADVGFLQGATTYGRLRTTAINSAMRLCGSRFGRGALRPGRSGIEMSPEVHRAIQANLDLLRKDLAIINDCFLGARTVQHRLRAVGTLAPAQAKDLGLVGLVGRASGILVDARQQMGHGVYKIMPIEARVLEDGDCWARASIRIAEMEISLAWLQLVLALYGKWERSRRPLAPPAPKQFAVAMVEGWRGEVIHCLETNEDGKLIHYKVQDPSFRNWMGLAVALRRNEISDFPICNKSFDLSYCGHDL